jgi:hypothetical protein
MKKIFVSILLSFAVSACANSDSSIAKKAVEEYAKNFPDATGTDCAGYDTDDDGYCSCTVFRGEKSPIRIDCGCEIHCLNCARGCKVVEGIKVNK